MLRYESPNSLILMGYPRGPGTASEATVGGIVTYGKFAGAYPPTDREVKRFFDEAHEDLYEFGTSRLTREDPTA